MVSSERSKDDEKKKRTFSLLRYMVKNREKDDC